jgi:hypothetical protein
VHQVQPLCHHGRRCVESVTRRVAFAPLISSTMRWCMCNELVHRVMNSRTPSVVPLKSSMEVVHVQ